MKYPPSSNSKILWKQKCFAVVWFYITAFKVYTVICQNTCVLLLAEDIIQIDALKLLILQKPVHRKLKTYKENSKTCKTCREPLFAFNRGAVDLRDPESNIKPVNYHRVNYRQMTISGQYQSFKGMITEEEKDLHEDYVCIYELGNAANKDSDYCRWI